MYALDLERETKWPALSSVNIAVSGKSMPTAFAFMLYSEAPLCETAYFTPKMLPVKQNDAGVGRDVVLVRTARVVLPCSCDRR